MKRGREFGGPGESNNDGKQRDFCWGLKLAKARDVAYSCHSSVVFVQDVVLVS